MNKYHEFFENFKRTKENNYDIQKYNILEKIVHTLINLNEDKLKMIYQVIKIITAINQQTDLSSLLSYDGDSLQFSSERVSSILDEKNSPKLEKPIEFFNTVGKDGKSVHSFEGEQKSKNNF